MLSVLKKADQTWHNSVEEYAATCLIWFIILEMSVEKVQPHQ